MMTFDWMIGKPQQELESLETGNGRVYVDTANLYSFGKHYGKERVLVLFAVEILAVAGASFAQITSVGEM
ncbi:uncharacterized protein K489DRAFT_382743, partial [Dissoconium aciculare CBS 342.82]|uniref:Uncharacterized protein n=1 Tax=Dissoconium aciculare CBS 342.82 TaxID=1314786 RepID=A0A6J3LYT4_9PEZI